MLDGGAWGFVYSGHPDWDPRMMTATSPLKTVSAEHAKQELGRLVQCSVKGHEVFRITHEAGEAVLLSREDYEALIDALEALSVPTPSRRFLRPTV